MGRAWTALCLGLLAVAVAVVFATKDRGAAAATTAPVATPAALTKPSANPAIAPIAAAAPQVDFNRDVVPILSGNCFKCHGPDPEQRQAGLRLDHRDVATKPLDSGETAIVPGKPDKSELVRRIFSSDPDVRMPPPASKKELTDAQKKTLRDWIAAGAVYEPHWSFVAPKQSPLPAVKQKAWPKNPLDYFVLAKLEAEGLHPSPEADRYTLIRRVSLDLIGLQPTPAEADAFVHDKSPDAYEKLVDRLLASPHYGERWARRWLDLARYADTNGYEKDRPRPIWPYRDWVINALNADMPFDEFTIEQLAGDLLPHATVEQKVATGFHRNTMLNEEGGIDPLEYRYYALVDRVATTGTTWLGLTVQCAQCHTHKFDPITNTDYYQFMAFLNNADEPEMEVPTPEITRRRADIEARVAKLTAELPDKFGADTNQWETPTAKVATASGGKAKPAGDGSWRFTGKSPERDVYTFTFDTDRSDVAAIRVEAMKDGARGPGRAVNKNFVLSEITASVAPIGSPKQQQPLKFSTAEADFSQNGWPVAAAIDGNPATGWAVDPVDGRPIEPHTATFTLASPVHFPQGAHWTVKLAQEHGERHTMARVRLSVGYKIGGAKLAQISRHEALQRAFDAWQKRESAGAVRWTVLRPVKMESTMPILTLKPDGSVLASGDTTKRDIYNLTFANPPAGITAVRLEVLPDDSLPAHGPGMVFYEGPFGDFFLSEINLAADGKDDKFVTAAATYSAPGFSIASAIDGDGQTGWAINGQQGKANHAVFGLSKPTAAAKSLSVRMLFERYDASPLGHFRISVTTDPRAAKSELLPPAVESALAKPAEKRTVADQTELMSYFLSVTPELASARAEIDQLRASEPVPPSTLVMRERPPEHPRPTFVHHRGEYLSTRQQVQPGVPEFLPPLPKGAPLNRLTFARWLVERDNPLTARVTVNRQWEAFFGRGIVRTTADFGYQGDPPSDQPLLDWLAVEFMNRGWSFKQLDRLIVTSATYRQSSHVSPELLARDPDNVLMARGPRFRMDAELIRDSALRAAGLLSEKIGGPSVFPPQPPSVTSEGAYGVLPWVASTGPDRYRRSLYTFAKRTTPFAVYNAFDAPTGEACVARREVSNSPLQALMLLNDTMFMEAAQAMGRTFASEKESDAARATKMFRRCLVRPPDKIELAMLVDFAGHERKHFVGDKSDAAKISGGDQKEKDVVERATWTALARAVMNLDEMITKN